MGSRCAPNTLYMVDGVYLVDQRGKGQILNSIGSPPDKMTSEMLYLNGSNNACP